MTGAYRALSSPAGNARLFTALEYLNRIGIALSAERNLDKLLETILTAAKTITHADGGTLYRLIDGKLKFEIMLNDSLKIAMGGTSGNEIPFYPIPIHQPDGSENLSMVAAYAALRDETVNIANAYEADGFDFSGTRNFDKKTGYRSTSFLTIPMKDHQSEIIGVLQLLNAQDARGKVVPSFTLEDQRLAESLCIARLRVLTNVMLISLLENLSSLLIDLINTAIDEKSPYTGGHCNRVPALTMMFAEAS